MTKNIDVDVRQFKLANGEEILCEVVQWSEHMEEIEILTRKAMRLIMQENGDGFKYYAFRPWMVYQESDCGQLADGTAYHRWLRKHPKTRQAVFPNARD